MLPVCYDCICYGIYKNSLIIFFALVLKCCLSSPSTFPSAELCNHIGLFDNTNLLPHAGCPLYVNFLLVPVGGVISLV